MSYADRHAIPMSLLTDHPDVQFTYFREGLGSCDVTIL
jgi:hypothetical protein